MFWRPHRGIRLYSKKTRDAHIPGTSFTAPFRAAEVQPVNIQSVGSAWQSEFRREMSGCAREWARRAA